MVDVQTLLITKHGSHLYNMSRADSDIDLYVVYRFPYQYRPKKQITQRINDESDTTKVSLDRFYDLCNKGVPQALEALFSPEDKWLCSHADWPSVRDDVIEDIQKNIITILETYRRTASNFFLEDNWKKNRHAFRLLHNADELAKTGRLNPSLSSDIVGEITTVADYPYNRRVEIFKDAYWNVFKDLDY